jgi:hypothetical protein
MANPSSDRQHLRNDLRELAKLAQPSSGSVLSASKAADSSGYVDLAALSASDPDWVERELARANGTAPRLPPPPPGHAARVSAPPSVVPVSLEKLASAETTARIRLSRGHKALFAGLGVAGVAAVSFLAFAVAWHPHHNAPAPNAVAAAMVASPATDPLPQPAVTSGDPASTSVPVANTTTPPDAVPPTAAVAAVHATPARTKAPVAARAHAVTATSSKAPALAAKVPAVVVPKSKPAPGGDSLMDMIKQSVASGK